MAEWSKAPVLKTGEVHASVGSNPTPSATAYPNSVAFPNELQAFTVSWRPRLKQVIHCKQCISYLASAGPLLITVYLSLITSAPTMAPSVAAKAALDLGQSTNTPETDHY